MSKQHFSILLVLTIAAAVAATLLVPGKTSRDSQAGPDLLFPTADDWINSVHQVRVVSAEGAVTLDRAEGDWRVAELEDYPADWNRLRGLLASLAQAEIIEHKTDNPAYYARLGVEDPESEDASGALLTLVSDQGEAALIVGKNASTGSGQYVRKADAAGSQLIDRELDVPRTAVDWAEREFLDVPAAEVKQVEIIHPDGDWVLVEKDSPADTDFALQNLPEGREVASSWTVNSLGGVMSALRMDDVVPAQQEGPDHAVGVRLMTFSGIEYTASVWEDDAGQWMQVQAGIPAASAGDAPESGSEPEQEPESDEARSKVEAFNGRVSGWSFRLPSYKFDALTKDSEDLLKPLEKDSAAEDE